MKRVLSTTSLPDDVGVESAMNGVAHCKKSRNGDNTAQSASTSASQPTSVSPLDGTIDNIEKLQVNSVLCFLCNKIDNYPRKLLKSTVLDFFREDEILSAKQTLHQICFANNKISIVQQYFKRRIGEHKTNAIVDDILNTLFTLDENGSLDFLPVFCVADTSRIPVLTDEMSDIVYVRKTVDELREQLITVMARLAELSPMPTTKTYCCMETQTDIVHDCRNDHHNALVQTQSQSYGTVSTGSLQSNTANNDQNNSGAVTAGGVTAGNAQLTESVQTDVQLPGYSGAVKSTMMSVGAGGGGRSDAVSGSTRPSNFMAQQRSFPSVDNDGYTTVNRHKPRRRNVVIGGCNDTPFQGVEKKAVVCVNRLNPDTEAKDVYNFLQENDVRVFDCSLVTKRSSLSAPAPASDVMDTLSVSGVDVDVQAKRRFISMRVTVSQSDMNRVMSTELWPRGVTIRPWTFKAKRAGAPADGSAALKH